MLEVFLSVAMKVGNERFKAGKERSDEGKRVALVFLVAGVSSRFGGKMKQFARVGPSGETLIEFSLNQALKSPFGKIIFIVGEKTEKPFKEKFGKEYKGVPIFYAKQTFDPKKREKPWGTLDALLCVRSLINGPFVVCTGDDIYGESAFAALYKFLSRAGKDCVAVAHRLSEVLPEKGSVNRGIIFGDGTKGEYGQDVIEIREFTGIKKETLAEKGLASDSMANMAIFGLQPETFPMLEKILAGFKATHRNDMVSECYLSDSLGSLVREKKLSMKIIKTRDRWFGITNPEDEETVRNEIKKFYS